MPVTPTRPVTAVIFDLDGTLIDSAPGLRDAACAMLFEMGLPQPDLATVIGFIGNGVPTLVARCLDWAGADAARQDDAFSGFMRHYNANPMSGTVLYPGAQDLLADLKARGLRLGLCTNKPEEPTRAILEALALGPFDAVTGGDTLPVHKPNPAPLLHTIAALGAAPASTVYVGDSGIDWETSRAAGVAYAHVEGGYQNTPIARFDPWLVIPDLAALADAI